jgi:hypothetical protein
MVPFNQMLLQTGGRCGGGGACSGKRVGLSFKQIGLHSLCGSAHYLCYNSQVAFGPSNARPVSDEQETAVIAHLAATVQRRIQAYKASVRPLSHPWTGARWL